MRILISGSSGFVGSSLIPHLHSKGYYVSCLRRNLNQVQKSNIFWDPVKKVIDPKSLEGYDVVIHLAGENIASLRWTKEKKNKIYKSRIDSTNFLVQNLKDLYSPPKLFICASATGYYGNYNDKVIHEDMQAGEGFLAKVCIDWEEEAKKVRFNDIRVVHLRFGMILSLKSGSLAKMLPIFKLGLGGKIGKGNQYISWISIDDTVHAIDYIIKNDSLSGAINIVAPNPVMNKDFTVALGRIIHRPVCFTIPSFFLRLILGEMAEELLLNSTRAIPEKLLQAGFTFHHETIDSALVDIFKK